MTDRDLSRRAVMRGALKAGAYSAPLIISASVAREVYAVSPAPLSNGSVVFTPFGTGYIGQGSGASPDAPFLFLLSDSDGNVLANKVVATNGAGRFTVTIANAGYAVGGAAAPAVINGGNMFVDLASTFGSMGTPTPSPTVSRGLPTLPLGTPIPTPTSARAPCLPGQVCDPTAIAQTAVSLTATASVRTP